MNSTLKTILIACAVASVLGILVVGAGVVWLLQELPTLSATISAPATVQLNSEFTLVVTAKNENTEDVTLDSIDFEDAFLEGFQVLEVEPKHEDTLHIFGIRSWSFEKTIGPGQSQEVRFKMKAVKEGHFSGDVDVCNPTQDFETAIADIVVEKR